MLEPWMQALLLAAAVLTCTLGLAWLALAKSSHWAQVRGDEQALPPGARRLLHALGTTALAASLALCLVADHPGMAVLVWVMALAAGALAVAMTLAWRPRWLVGLLIWPTRR